MSAERERARPGVPPRGGLEGHPEARREARRGQLELVRDYFLTAAVAVGCLCAALVLIRGTWFTWFEI